VGSYEYFFFFQVTLRRRILVERYACTRFRLFFFRFNIASTYIVHGHWDLLNNVKIGRLADTGFRVLCFVFCVFFFNKIGGFDLSTGKCVLTISVRNARLAQPMAATISCVRFRSMRVVVRVWLEKNRIPINISRALTQTARQKSLHVYIYYSCMCTTYILKLSRDQGKSHSSESEVLKIYFKCFKIKIVLLKFDTHFNKFLILKF